MADETKEPGFIAPGMRASDPALLTKDDGVVNMRLPPEPVSAVDRLKAFEDEHLGEDAVRINGQIERGVGSPFAKMKPEQRRQHAALEKLVAAEATLSAAHAALIKADTECEAAAKEAADAAAE